VQTLVDAIKTGDPEKVRELLKSDPSLAQAKKNDVSFLLLCLYAGKPELADEFEAAGAPIGLFEACALGRAEVVEQLLAGDAQLAKSYSPDGHSPLGLACFFGRTTVAMLLIERGADVNAASQNNMQVRPLHSAVARRSRSLVELLLARGADVNAKQQAGYTPLHGAAAAGDRELVEILLAQGADRAAKSDDGKTPQELATERGHADVAALLG
jgi:ankyrin repeat protein